MPDILTRIMNRAKQYYSDSPLYELHPDLVNRIPILRAYSDDETALATSNFARNSSDYQRHTWTHKAIKVLADNISPHRLEVVRGDGEEREPVDNHDLRPLLETPNDEMSPSDLWRQWITDMMLGGEEGFEVTFDRGNRIREMWARQPTIFTVRPGEGGLRYRRVKGYRIEDHQGDPYLLAPEFFIHIKFYNPSNPWRGVAPIEAIRMGIMIDQLAQAWSRLFFRNQARPDYAVLTDEGLTPKEKTQLELQLSAEFGRPEGWHKPLVLEEAVKDVKPLSFPPKDLAWLEQRKFSRDEVGAIFGVPDEIMGYGKDTYENFATAYRVLWTLTLNPLIDFRDNALTSWFRRYGHLAADERIETDRSKVPALPEDDSKKFEQGKTLFGMGVPLNDINRRLQLGLPDLEGGDIGYLPIGLYPVTESGPPDRDDPDDEERSAKGSKWSYGLGAPELDSDDHKELMKRKRRPLEPAKDEMKRKLRKFFQGQQIRVSRRLRDSRDLGRGRYVDKDDKQVPPIDDLFDLEEEIRIFEEEFGPIIGEAIRLAGDFELGLLGIDEAFDITRPEVVAAFRSLLTTVARKTQETVWTDLISLFEEAEEEGIGIVEIQERLSTFYGGKKSNYETERIARTTMTGAQNAGAMEAWKQSEIVALKEWVSALLPNRTRPAHETAHAQRRKLDEAFDVGGEPLMYPGDPEASVGNIVNCLCTTAPVVTDEGLLSLIDRRLKEVLQ